MKKALLIITALCFIATAGIAQQYQVKQELSVSCGPSAGKIKNKNITEDKYKTVDDKNGFNLDLLYTRYIHNSGVGLSLGVGYSTYHQLIYQKGLIENFSQTDKDGNLYDEWIDSDMKYENKIGTIDIPVNLHFIFGKSQTYDGVIDIGVVNHFLANTESSEKGSIENMGKYDTGNPYFAAISQNNSYYDYHVEFHDSKYTDRYSRYGLSLHFAAGLAIAMNERLSFKTQLYTNIGVTDVAAKDLRGEKYVNVINLKSDYEKTKLFAAGINIGFVIKLGN
ncbi:MAG: hypothetical protein ACJ77K_02750 [Bacteroidia bacterium]